MPEQASQTTTQNTSSSPLGDLSEDGEITTFDKKLVRTKVLENITGKFEATITDVSVSIDFPDKTRLFDLGNGVGYIPADNVDDALITSEDGEKVRDTMIPQLEKEIVEFFESDTETIEIPVIDSSFCCIQTLDASITEHVNVIYTLRKNDTGETFRVSTPADNLSSLKKNGDMENLFETGNNITVRADSDDSSVKLSLSSLQETQPVLVKYGLGVLVPLIGLLMTWGTSVGLVFAFVLFVMIIVSIGNIYPRVLSPITATKTVIDTENYFNTDIIDRVETFQIETINGIEYLSEMDGNLRVRIEDDNQTITDDAVEFFTDIGMERVDDAKFNVRVTNDPDVYRGTENKLQAQLGIYLLPQDA